MIGYVCDNMNRIMRLLRSPEVLCKIIDNADVFSLNGDATVLKRLLEQADRSLIKPYHIKRAKYYKIHNGKRYEYEYLEIYDRKGSRYVKPKPIFRINVKSEEAKKVEDVVRAATLLDKLAGVLREARFIAEELIDFLSKYCGDS